MHPHQIADLPCWIDSDYVDSWPMLAYKTYLERCHAAGRHEELGELRHLWVINHKKRFCCLDCLAANSDPTMLEIECAQQTFKHCDSLSGGWPFRWYDKRWYNEYANTVDQALGVDLLEKSIRHQPLSP